MYVGFLFLFFASPSSKNQKVLFLSSKIRHAHTKAKKKKEKKRRRQNIYESIASHELESIHSIYREKINYIKNRKKKRERK
jgi:hypothetical protein